MSDWEYKYSMMTVNDLREEKYRLMRLKDKFDDQIYRPVDEYKYDDVLTRLKYIDEYIDNAKVRLHRS